MSDVSVSREIAAPPQRVWELISDITRMGEWSPETTGGKWLKGATGPAVGARFRGT
ncbi:MAG TPA: SRPBCC family protein, partial [Acidimicrobiaceae bacterium]|nr:SRPBCC family protein [Acidimicrobiaceae bacterium]